MHTKVIHVNFFVFSAILFVEIQATAAQFSVFTLVYNIYTVYIPGFLKTGLLKNVSLSH